MGSYYSNYVIPKVQDSLMHSESFVAERKILDRAKGKVLEIGFGTGLNVPFYDATKVTELVGVLQLLCPSASFSCSLMEIDPVEGMKVYAEAQAEKSTIPVKVVIADAAKLPFDDDSFDTVTSTWTMCTIPDVLGALQEVNRVLKPGGEFIFVEHGVSRNEKTKSWQDWVNPPYKVIAGGCHLNRDISDFVKQSGLEVKSITEWENEKSVWIANSWYKGVATKGTKPKTEPTCQLEMSVT